MPAFPIVDSHVHLYDMRQVGYAWLARRPGINHPHLADDNARAMGGLLVDRLVFAEVWADKGNHLKEADWLARHSATNPIVAAMIAAAPLENGEAIAADLDYLQSLPLFRAARRITEAEPDPDFCARPGFVDGVRLLGRRGIVCDICVFEHQLPGVVTLARRCPDTCIVLDHIGKPAIRRGEMDPWRRQIRQLAALPNVFCKLSGVLTEADQENWSFDAIRPYMQHAIDSFGFERMMFGSDWPVLSLTTTFTEWVAMVDKTIQGCSDEERQMLFRDTATRVYKL